MRLQRWLCTIFIVLGIPLLGIQGLIFVLVVIEHVTAAALMFSIGLVGLLCIVWLYFMLWFLVIIRELSKELP